MEGRFYLLLSLVLDANVNQFPVLINWKGVRARGSGCVTRFKTAKKKKAKINPPSRSTCQLLNCLSCNTIKCQEEGHNSNRNKKGVCLCSSYFETS